MILLIRFSSGHARKIEYEGTLDDLENFLSEKGGCGRLFRRIGGIFVAPHKIDMISEEKNG